MASKSPRLLIVDQSLRDVAGHHYEYDLALSRAAAEADVPAIVGAHFSVQGLDLLGDRVRPWFRKAWYEAHRDDPRDVSRSVARELVPERVRARLAPLVRRLRGRTPLVPAEPESGFGQEVLQLIRAEQLGRSDHVLVHTFSIPQLDSLIALAGAENELPIVHLVLRRDADEPSVASGPSGGIRGSLARVIASPSARGTLRLHADTEDLARQYGQLGPGLEIDVVPIPHCLPAKAAVELARPGAPLRIAYLGDARREKGFHLIPDAVDALADSLFSEQRARFVIQSNMSVAGEDPDIVLAQRRLAAYPQSQVELLEKSLNMDTFHQLILGSQIVLLPYERSAYTRRSSGILVQALAAGCVTILPSGTWLAKQVDSISSVQFGDERSLQSAIEDAVDRYQSLAEAARQRGAGWRERHAASRYVAQLLRSRR